MCVKSEQQKQYENQDKTPKIPWSETVFGRLEALELDTKNFKADMERLMLILTCDRDDDGEIKLSDAWLEIGNQLEAMNNSDDT